MFIDALLTQKAYIEAYRETRDGHPIYTPEKRPRRCRVIDKANLKRGFYTDGQYDSEPAGTTMYTTGDMIPERSRVTVDGKTYTVAACSSPHGFGQSHLEVLLD